MTNRILSVAEALRSALIGAGTSAGNRVYLARIRPLTEDRRPLPNPTAPRTYITVQPLDTGIAGGDGPSLVQHIDWLATFGVDLHVRAKEAAWYPALMSLWAETHAALMADQTQGLAYVVTTDPMEAGEPDPDPDGDMIHAEMRTVWRLHIRTSVESLES